jgi:gluconolactonase
MKTFPSSVPSFVACVAVFLQGCSAAMPAQPLLPARSGSEIESGATANLNEVDQVTPDGPGSETGGIPDFCVGILDEAPLETRVQATLIRDGFVFVEGPVWSQKKGAFFFSEMNFDKEGPQGPPAKIHQLTLATEDAPAQLAVFIEESGSNGLALDDSGLVACTHDEQRVALYSLETKARTVLVSDFQGKHFNSPNDVTVHTDGHIYFTDPDWQLGKRVSETGMTGVYMRNNSGVVTLVDGGLPKPNGITLSPDQTRLYVGSVNGEIGEYAVAKDGSVGERRLFAEVEQPDGMAIDCAGNLYVASHGPGQVVVLSKEGELISTILVGSRTTNAAFGGPDRTTLLITSGSGIYSIETKIPGLPY